MQVPRIYAIADARRWAPRPLPEVVGELAQAGWPWIQVRDKDASDADLLRLAEACVQSAAGTSSLIWINDRADIAAMAGAWGVHLGEDDPPPGALREQFPGLAIGRTTRDATAVAEADADPAVDLIAFGPVFATRTKSDVPEPRGVQALDRVRDLTDKPLIAVGGIGSHAIPDLRWAGVNTVAVTGVLAESPSLVAEWVSRYSVAAEYPWPRIFLIGFMATGKSCIGRRLAAVLGWEFVDLDSMVRQETRKTVGELFAEQGESAFRTQESAALRRALECSRAVIACGGGSVERSENRRLLKGDAGVVVWLDVPEGEIVDRLAASPVQRPLADSSWRDRLADRRPRYAECADIEIDVIEKESVQRTTRRVYDRLAA